MKFIKACLALFLIWLGLKYLIVQPENVSFLFGILVLISFACTTIDAFRQNNKEEKERKESGKRRSDSNSTLEVIGKVKLKKRQIGLLVCGCVIFFGAMFKNPDVVNNYLTAFGLAIYFVVGLKFREIWPIWLILILEFLVFI